MKSLPRGVRAFVFIMFLVMGLSFYALPYMLWQEFGGTDWISIALFHSYLFVFYPLFGFVILVAFYRPAVCFTDLYWHHKPYGRFRFINGFLVALILAAGTSAFLLHNTTRSVWEVRQTLPTSAANIRSTCSETGTGCNAGPVLSTMFAVRQASLNRIGLQPFTRSCVNDALVEPPADADKLRHCFPAGKKLDAPGCCRAQAAFSKKVQASAFDWKTKSDTGFIHAVTLPFKTFFVIVMITIAVFLVVWHDEVKLHYGPLLKRIERGLVVGAFAMLLWPLMEYAYGQSAGVMFGNWEPGFNFKASFIAFPWFVLIGVYFLRSRGFGQISQVTSIFGAIIAAFQYDQVTNWAVRFTGSGAGRLEAGLLAALAVACLVVVWWPGRGERGAAPPAKARRDDAPKRPAPSPVAAADPREGIFR